MKSSHREYVEVIVVCFALSYLALLPNFYLIYQPHNRAYMLWDHSLHAAIVTAITILGLIYSVLILMGLRVFGRCSKIPYILLSSMFMFVLIRSFVALADRTKLFPDNIQYHIDKSIYKFIYYLLLPFAVTIIAPKKTFSGLAGILKCIAPAYLLIIVLPLKYKTYIKSDLRGLEEVVKTEDINVSHETTYHPSIYVFIFDEWSYERTLAQTNLYSLMPSVSRLMQRSIVFTNAISAGGTTIVSIPRMLYPTNPSVENMSYADLYKSVTKGHVKATSGTIYDLVGDEYVKILSGFYMDYESIMNSRIDYVRTYQDGEAFFRTYKSEVERLLMTQLSWLRHVGIRLKKPVPRIGWIVAQRKIHEDAIYTIENLKHPVFAVFHYCLPHYPYAWAREGEREWSVDTVNLHTVSNYLGNVQRLDRVVEEIMNALHDRHEDCLVILTSDHAWRMDPDLANWEVLNDYPAEMIDEEPDSPFRHVPLIVYTGRSGDVGLVGKSINVGDLHLILSRYLAGESIMTADWPRVKNY